jgi:putative transposase
MIVDKAYKTELQINNKQSSYFEECAGLARFVYNWALDYWIEEHKEGNKRTGWMKLGTELTKQKQSEFSWMYKYSNWIRTYALKNCDQAYQNFFRNVKNGKTPGFPKFKSRKTAPKKFTINGQTIKITETKIRLPIIGWICMKEHGYIPVNKKVLSATISEKNGRWYISVLVEETLEQAPKPEKIIGVDLGIKHLAVTSEGVYYENPKSLYKQEKKLKRLDRKISRKVKGSKNREKAKLIRAKAYEKVARIREHSLHCITTELARTKSIIVVEDLNVSGMQKNHHLAKAISDASFAEFRRMLEYKCNWYGSELIVIDRFFPSSKTCSNCGAIMSDLKLSDRVYKCSDCGFEIDRDLNAAINLKNRAKHAQINACGEDNVRPVDSLWAASLKQEASCEVCYA